MKRHLLYSTSLIAGLSVAGLSSVAFARSETPEVAIDLTDVVVTATRLPAIVAETPGARVIDERTIEQRGAVFASDILSDIPGLSVTRSGIGGVAQVRMRGATPGKTLVLVDGAPVNDAAEPNGAYDFAGFELGDISRIEVLSGPQSSLWGSDAIGGVIAFTTREVNGVRAEAEYGSHDTLRHRLAAGVANDQYAAGAWISHYNTRGISAADEADGNTEADGFENYTVGAKGRYAFTETVQIDGTLRWSESKADLDGFPAPTYALADTRDTSKSEQWSGVVGLSANAFGLNHRFSVSASDIERANNGDFSSVFNAERQVYRWQADGKALSDRVDFAFGVEREDTAGSISTGASVDLGTTSVFGVARYDVTEDLTVTGGLRYDDTDDFGAETTGRISAAYHLPAGFILSGAYGTGFKAPSVSQAVCDYCFSAVPYPTLTPETADSVEGAIGWASADSRIDGRITVYRLNVDDQISYFTDPVTFDSYYVNIAQTRTDGVEAEAHAALGQVWGGGFDLTLAYAWTEATDQTTGARLLRVPEHAGSATLAWTGEKLSGALTVRAEGDQPDAGGVRESFVTANLNLGYAITEGVVLTARIENLADERYQQVFGYGEPGRSAYVGVRLRY